MIKLILGGDNGLILETQKKDIYLCPAKKNKIQLKAVNDTEYDMHLYMSFEPSAGTGYAPCEFDFFVPAQGNSVKEIPIEVSGDARLYFGYGIAELRVRDRVLEWESIYEIPLMCENIFKCSEKPDFAADGDMCCSSKGVIYLSKGEYAMLLAASSEEKDICICVTDGGVPETTVNGEKSGTKFTLKEGLNRLCFYAKEDTAFYLTEDISERTICLNTVNPKYFI